MYTIERLLNWCEVLQTEVHEGPYPPRSRCDDLLIRLTLTIHSGRFVMTDKPRYVLYNFSTPLVIAESKIWVNFSSQEKRCGSAADMYVGLAGMGVDRKDLQGIVEEIFEAVEQVAVPLPQLAIDVTIRFLNATLEGSFDHHDEILFYKRVRKSWAQFNTSCSTTQMPLSCAVCLEDFGGDGGGDKLITRLPCLHYFHGHCVAHWVKNRHTCPLCRSQIMPILCDESGPSDPNSNPNPNRVVE